MTARRIGKFRRGEMFSLRLDTETARELRWAAAEQGKAVADLLRDGLGPVLAYIRAEWYEKHGINEDDWEEVPAVATAGPRRELAASFGVRLSGDQIPEIGDAARACGITISAYLRQAGLALAAAQQAGGTARCGHLSAGNVTSAECGICGPLPVAYTVRP